MPFVDLLDPGRASGRSVKCFHTGADCRGWMEETGFREVRIEPLQGPYSIAVGRK